MKNNKDIMSSPNWKYEVLACINEFYQNIQEKFVESKIIDAEKYFEKFTKYKKAVFDELIPIYKNKYIALEPFLEEDESEGISIIHTFFTYFLGFDTKSINNKCIDEYFSKKVINIMNEAEDCPNIDVNCDFTDTNSMVKVLNKFGFDDKLKMKIISLTVDRYSIINKMIEMVEELSPICEKYFYIIKNDFDKAYDNINDKDNLLEYLSDSLPVKFKITDMTYCLSIFHFSLIYVKFKDEVPYINLGIYSLELSSSIKNNYNDERFVSDLKKIADVTRFKILTSINKEPMYLQQIAEKLSLTPATISHHVNLMLDANILNVVLEPNKSKRIYYKINYDKINEIINVLSSITNND